ncbi:hypothetical protein [Lactococcus garvieae]|uniref:Uncharacterized protein n=1 Tax=Lactococcus garvieae TaxID=1363 RepID=A0AA46YRD2_9LACT|nr:hypothetical protein [Lactococcus garvieae]UYT10392.1 hypothetical protein OF801_00190 [Lactococcus garvieae]UYT12433.1 hypothetical protein OF800_00195 [Lactococcus garvieae]
MEFVNTLLGIVASIFSIGSIIFSKKVSKENKKIMHYLENNYDFNMSSRKNDLFSVKKATSGEKGISVIADNSDIRSRD